MLHKDLALLLAKDIGELVLVSALLLIVTDLRLPACLFVQFVAGHFVSAQSQVERRAHLAERNRAHLDCGFSDFTALEVPELDRFFVTTACENHHSFELCDVRFFQVLLMEEV